MLIPFSAPQLPELDALSDEQHKDVFAQYASSGESARLIKRVRVMFYVALACMFAASVCEGAIRILLGLTAILLMPGAIVVYRKSAESALRTIILDLQK